MAGPQKVWRLSGISFKILDQGLHHFCATVTAHLSSPPPDTLSPHLHFHVSSTYSDLLFQTVGILDVVLTSTRRPLSKSALLPTVKYITTVNTTYSCCIMLRYDFILHTESAAV